ncbi:NAD(P)-binding domain-containing protein [Mycobacterium sp. AMU20-3851]|uniref:NAD(P)-dependent oxidoreductase n=1 Tax=Mycobacterium sp. AMU20-3851 TaxID=3122055 RepID=UPI00375535F4
MNISFVGLGEMGSALARTVAGAGHRVTVWNRSAAKAEGFPVVAATVGEAVKADLVVVCLFDHRSVHDVLDPVADQLAGVRLLNLTTTSPAGARELAQWATGLGATYLDGGILATPEMIGTPESRIFYSGDAQLLEDHRAVLELWGSAEYFGDDAGVASLYDLALLSAMYVMFAGFFHGAAMLSASGVTAGDFAAMAVPWLQVTAEALPNFATVIDGTDYTVPGQQSLLFSDISEIIDASRDQGVSTEVVDVVQRLIHRQIDAGHGTEGFARIIEGLRAVA